MMATKIFKVASEGAGIGLRIPGEGGEGRAESVHHRLDGG